MKMTCCAFLVAGLLGGCMLAPQPKPPVAVYDFGLRYPAVEASRINARLLVPDIAAPSWLDATDISYRLAYANDAQTRSYTNSRWVGAPAALLSQRMRQWITAVNEKGGMDNRAGTQADYMVRMELQEFSQVFDSEQASYGLIRLHASLIRRPEGALIAQQSFTVKRDAPNPNAEGAVKALTDAGDGLIVELLDWLTRNIDKR
jgi:cholesterol transport system auxiliary component